MSNSPRFAERYRNTAIALCPARRADHSSDEQARDLVEHHAMYCARSGTWTDQR